MKHIVGFSGGIDSQACCLWARQRFPAEDIIIMNSEAGRNEHPLTVQHVRWYSENVFPVVECVPLVKDLAGVGTKDGATGERRKLLPSEDAELTFPMLAFVKGRFPSRKAQFCTNFLKLAPQKRWIEENLVEHGIAYERYTGVRADESQDRKGLPETEWDDWFDCELHRPLLRWTKKQCFDFVLDAGEKINPLYTFGFSRVGCAPCINSGKGDVRNWAARFPEMIDKVRQWEKEVGRTFFAPCVPGKEINWVDEVVAWSKTTHGGGQLALPFVETEAETGACSSKYGLCE